MSVLDTFVMLFESDADKAAKDFDKFEKAGDKVEDNLGDIKQESDNLNESINSLASVVIAGAAAFLTLATAKTALDLTDDIDQFGKLTTMLGLNLEKTGAYGQAAIRAGGDIQAFTSSIESLNEQLVETSLVGTSSIIPFFNLLGISALDANGKARDVFQVLPEIASAFENLSKAESAALGKKMGFDEGTIMLLQKGRREVDLMVKRQKSLGVITKEQAKIAAELNESLSDTNQIFGTLARELLLAASPAIKGFLDIMTDVGVWIRENKDFIAGFFISIASVITAYYLPAMANAARATLLAMLPFLLAIGILALVGTAFGLLYDDIVNFQKGNDSIIGRVMKKWEDLKEFFKEIGDIISEQIKGWIADIENMFKDNKVIKFISSLDPLSPDGVEGDFLQRGAQLLGEASSFPLAAQTSGSIANSTINQGGRTISIGDVTIQTQATDSQGIAKDFKQQLSSQIQGAINSFDDGVEA